LHPHVGFRYIQRRGNHGDRTQQHEWIVPRWDEATAQPESARFSIDRIHHESASADQRRRLNAALERMLREQKLFAIGRAGARRDRSG